MRFFFNVLNIQVSFCSENLTSDDRKEISHIFQKQIQQHKLNTILNGTGLIGELGFTYENFIFIFTKKYEMYVFGENLNNMKNEALNVLKNISQITNKQLLATEIFDFTNDYRLTIFLHPSPLILATYAGSVGSIITICYLVSINMVKLPNG